MTEVHLSKSAEVSRLKIFDLTLAWLAKSAETGGALTFGEGLWQPGGFAPSPHIHKEQDEAFYIIDGSFEFRVGNDVIQGGKGDLLFVPRGTLHSFVPIGDAPTRALFLYTPAAGNVEDYFLELAKLAEKGRPEPQKVRSLMNKWGMETPQ